MQEGRNNSMIFITKHREFSSVTRGRGILKFFNWIIGGCSRQCQLGGVGTISFTQIQLQLAVCKSFFLLIAFNIILQSGFLSIFLGTNFCVLREPR